MLFLARPGLAIGLALQGSLSNFAAGVLMIIFKPFRGERKSLMPAGFWEPFREIGIFTTVIDTLDNRKTIVPNAKLMSDKITNYSANDTRRVDLIAGISYGDDIDKARATIKEVLSGIPEILETPAPDILVSEMADSCVKLFGASVVPAGKTTGRFIFGATEGIKKKVR